MPNTQYARLMELLGTQQEGVFRSQEIVDEEDMLMRLISIQNPTPEKKEVDEASDVNSLITQSRFSEEQSAAALVLSEEDAALAEESIRAMNEFRL
ncbi:hypothetical protein [Legionella fallonii]|uniref:Uncharacterized protein n=1 Tax=Legionella fallonii LLAP-10 TaxID=1212491 RepID=A0A098G887_9GAMM|nr:hypothetical protein [Legionella fallonii]CEG58698.1 protein of unknown function [Legionella fallonii LLAP-10]